MEKGRWVFVAILVIGTFTVGIEKIEPLWYSMRRDPIIGIIIGVLFLLLILFVVRLIRQ